MPSYKKVIIPVEIHENATNYLRSLNEMELIKNAEVHFVHVFHTMSYPTLLGQASLTYPVEVDRKSMEESALSLLGTLSKKVLGESFRGKVLHKVLFSENEKKAFTRYVNEEKPDLIIIPTRSKHGIFESSFASYVNTHSESDVLMLKHKS